MNNRNLVVIFLLACSALAYGCDADGPDLAIHRLALECDADVCADAAVSDTTPDPADTGEADVDAASDVSAIDIEQGDAGGGDVSEPSDVDDEDTAAVPDTEFPVEDVVDIPPSPPDVGGGDVDELPDTEFPVDDVVSIPTPPPTSSPTTPPASGEGSLQGSTCQIAPTHGPGTGLTLLLGAMLAGLLRRRTTGER
jgi:MYXO-CTERM domain-containing protein